MRYKATAGGWEGRFSNEKTAIASAKWHSARTHEGCARKLQKPWLVVDLRTGAVVDGSLVTPRPAVRAS